jgi:glycosyltransferase involved in cell wall biosynthesis
MRVLFIHAAENRLTPEYRVHANLASAAREHQIESYFLWQKPLTLDAGVDLAEGSILPFDAGRDLARLRARTRPGRVAQAVGGHARGLLTALSWVRRLRPDVIYTSQQRVDVWLAQLLSRQTATRHIIHLHYNVGSWLGAGALRAIRRTPHLIAISEFIRQTALLEGIPPAHVRTILNTIDARQYRSSADRAGLRARYGWPGDSLVVVAAGRLDPGKGHLQLIKAFAQVAAQCPQARLLICGRSTTPEQLELQLRQGVSELGLEGVVAFAGYVNDIFSVLCSADVFCLPSELEPFGLVYLEAMLAELPVVALYSGAVPEIVSHSVHGLLAYPGDEALLAEYLLRVMVQPELAHQLGQAGRARALADFAPQRSAERWAKLLHGMPAW